MSKIEYRTLNDLAYDEIKRGLMAATFYPGQALIIRTLADTYGISTTPIREALQRLVAERLLVMLPNRTIAVPPLELEKFRMLVRIRSALEDIAAEMAFDHITSKHIDRLKQLYAEMDDAVTKQDYAGYRRLNQEFHFAIYEQAHAPGLLQMIQDLWSQAGPYMMELFNAGSWGEGANEQHRLMIEALDAGNRTQFQAHVVDDIVISGKFLIPRLNQIMAGADERSVKQA